MDNSRYLEYQGRTIYVNYQLSSGLLDDITLQGRYVLFHVDFVEGAEEIQDRRIVVSRRSPMVGVFYAMLMIVRIERLFRRETCGGQEVCLEEKVVEEIMGRGRVLGEVLVKKCSDKELKGSGLRMALLRLCVR
jgi:hypothetical protein